MLEIQVSASEEEFFDEKAEKFISLQHPITLQLEHSLVSLKKWEKKWHKPFLEKEDKTTDEIIDYIRCMTLNEHIDPNVYHFITESQVDQILKYIEDPMTATWFSNDKKEGEGTSKKQIITAEIIYYWMISLNVPVEFQYWHLNELLTLIRVINAKSEKPKKMSKQDILRQNSKLNAARRAKRKSRG